jgi:1-acyl-sn-glycerol-3-phosphate acyltransferase
MRRSAAITKRDRSRLPAWPRFARGFVRVAFSLLFRPRIEGVPPMRGPYILVANHQGWADGFLLIGFFPPEPRLHFFADEEGTTGTWWKALVVKSLGGFVRVDRSVALDRSAVEVALRYLAEGAVLAVFAEGRVSRAEADLAPFERGVAYLALKAKVPVLPVCLRGTAELYLGRELIARVGTLRQPPDVSPTKQATADFARVLYEDVRSLAEPWREPAGVRKRWRWLTDIF